jgi:hypothetical protein
VSARGRDAEFEDHRVLLGDADKGDGLTHARHAVVNDAALVEQERVVHAASGQLPRDRGGPAGVAAVFFVVPERQVDRALGREPRADERLGGFEQTEHTALVVDRAASPDLAALDRAAEGRLGPGPPGRLGRDDVQVREQDDRRQIRAAAKPGIEQRIGRDRLARQHPPDRGKPVLQIRVQAEEGAGIALAGIAPGNRRKLQGSSQSFGGRGRVDRDRCGRTRGRLAALQTERADRPDGDHRRQGKQDDFGNAFHVRPGSYRSRGSVASLR